MNDKEKEAIIEIGLIMLASGYSINDISLFVNKLIEIHMKEKGLNLSHQIMDKIIFSKEKDQ